MIIYAKDNLDYLFFYYNLCDSIFKYILQKVKLMPTKRIFLKVVRE